MPEVAWNLPRPSQSYGSGTEFNVQDFAGSVQWRNILSEAENPDGNIGFFRSVLQASHRPLNPYLGYTIRVKRCGSGSLGKLSCTGS